MCVVSMTVSRSPPQLEFARPGANPTLGTMELIRSTLRRADGPISRDELLKQLTVWRHSTSLPSLNAAIRFLAVDGAVAEGSKGLTWVPRAPATLRNAIRSGLRL
jgi:hypothetical protein